MPSCMRSRLRKRSSLSTGLEHPDWAADNAARTIADLIHDWMWTDLKQQLDSLPHVNLIDQDPRREIAVRVHSEDRLFYLLRIKLHHLDGRPAATRPRR